MWQVTFYTHIKWKKCLIYWWMKHSTASGSSHAVISLGKHATVFQAEVYVIRACVHETKTEDRLEKYFSICSYNQAALKALLAAKTASPLVQRCQKALNNISIRRNVVLYWVPVLACWSARKWNRQQARKGRFCSTVGWTWGFLGGL